MKRNRKLAGILIGLVLTATLLLPVDASAQNTFLGPRTGGPATGTVVGDTLTYNGATYARVNGKATFPDCTVYIATDNGLLIPAGVAAGCTPTGGSTAGSGSSSGGSSSSSSGTTGSSSGSTAGSTTAFVGPNSGGPTRPTSVTPTTITYDGATYSRVGGKVTFPDCTVFIVMDSGLMIPAGLAAGCAPVTSSTGSSSSSSSSGGTTSGSSSSSGSSSGSTGGSTSFVGPTSGGPSAGSVSGNTLTYNGATYTRVNGKVTFPDCTVYITMDSGTLIPSGMAAGCVPTTGTGSGSTSSSSSGSGSGNSSGSNSTAGLGPSNGGPKSGTLVGSTLTYNGQTFAVNANLLVQLPDCKVYLAAGNGAVLIYQRDAASCGATGSTGTTGTTQGGTALETWSAPKQVVTTWGTRMSIYGIGMAYDKATRRFLMVWRAGWSGCGGTPDSVWGQFLDSNADPLGGLFLISTGNNCAWSYSSWEPSVAASGDGRFMVTYAISNGAPFATIFNMVEYNGGAQVSAPITIAPLSSHEAPNVAWLPHTQQFMVMWSTYYQPKAIYSMAITRDGGLAQAYRVTDNADYVDMAQAKIAQGDDNNVMVIVWRDSTNGAMSSRGGISYTRVTENGSPLMNTGNVVGPNGGFYRYPQVAWNTKAKQYMTIYTDYGTPGCNGSPSGGNIMGRQFDLSGNPAQPASFTVLGTNRCNATGGDDQFTELGFAYEPVNDTYVAGARGQDSSGAPLPVYRLQLNSSGQTYSNSLASVNAAVESTSPVPVIVPDGTGRVLYAYRSDYMHIAVMWGSR